MKPTSFSFNNRLLFLLSAFVLALFSCNDVSSGLLQNSDRDIYITKGYKSNGKLTLVPTGEVQVYAGKKVTWHINPSATNVSSFRIQMKASTTSTDIFDSLEQPPKKHTKEDGGRVDKKITNAVYEYDIFWIDSLNPKKEYRFDPKISVKPSLSGQLLITIVVGLVAMFFGFTFLRKKLSKKRS